MTHQLMAGGRTVCFTGTLAQIAAYRTERGLATDEIREIALAVYEPATNPHLVGLEEGDLVGVIGAGTLLDNNADESDDLIAALSELAKGASFATVGGGAAGVFAYRYASDDERDCYCLGCGEEITNPHAPGCLLDDGAADAEAPGETYHLRWRLLGSGNPWTEHRTGADPIALLEIGDELEAGIRSRGLKPIEVSIVAESALPARPRYRTEAAR